MIAITIALILSLALYFLFNQQQKQHVSEKLASELQGNMRFILDQLNRDLLMAGHIKPKAADLGPPDKIVRLSCAATNSITFDFWDDSAQDTSPWFDKHFRITYRLMPMEPPVAGVSRLVKEVRRYRRPPAGTPDWETTATAYTIAEFVQGIAFEYFDKENNAILPCTLAAAPADVCPTCPCMGTELEKVHNIKVCATVRSYDRDPLAAGGPNFTTIAMCRTVRARNLDIATSSADSTPPDPPTNLRAINPQPCGTMEVRWDSCNTPDLSHYMIYLRRQGTTIWERRTKVPGSQTGHTFTDLESTTVANLALPIVYEVGIQAVDTSANASPITGRNANCGDVNLTPVSGNPPTSVRNWADWTTLGDDTTVNPDKPLPPASFDSHDGPAENQTTLVWTASTSPDVAKYLLYRCPRKDYPAGATEDCSGFAALAGGALEPYKLAEVADPTVLTHSDTTLIGCTTHYYKIATANCDEGIVPMYLVNDYRLTWGDGDRPDIPADVPTPTVSDTWPVDTASIDDNPIPVPTITSLPGWKRVFLTLRNPNLTDDPDFSHTDLFWSKGADFPGLISGTCDFDPASGDTLKGWIKVPETLILDGRVAMPGNMPIIRHEHETEAKPAEPWLTNSATYRYLAISYDRCGNCTTEKTEATTLSDLCGDDPVGLPQCSPPITLAGDADGCFGYVNLTWGGECLKNYDPDTNPGVQDFSGFQIFRSEGATYDDATAIDLTGGSPGWFPTHLWTDATAEAGKVYSYAVKWLDCAYANNNGGNISNPDFDGGKIENVGIGAVVEEETKPVLTGDLTISPAVYTHNKVTLHIRNTAGVPLQLNELRLEWSNPLARIFGVKIGDDMTTPSQVVWGDIDVQPVITAFSTPVTTLTAGVTAIAPTIPVAATAAFPMAGVVSIGSEMIAYNGKTATSLLNSVRGTGPTVADAHLMGDQVHYRGVYATLASDLGAADVSAFVSGTVNFSAAGTIYIGGEKIDYTSLGINQFAGLQRGTGGTVASDHPAGTVVYQITSAVSGCTGGAGGGLTTPASLGFTKDLLPLDGEIPLELYFGNENGCADSNADMREETLTLTLSYTNTSTGSACGADMTLQSPNGPVAGNVIQDKPENPTFAWAVPGYGGTNAKDNVLVVGDAKVTVQSNVFFPTPGASTSLSAAIDAGVTTIPVFSTDGFPDVGTLVIGSEQVAYTGKDATNFTGCTRGANATAAVAHVADFLVYRVENAESVDLFYYCDPGGTLQEPPFNQLPTLYTQLPMRRVAGSLWRLYEADPIDGADHRIPACNNSSVWYYLLAKDSDGNFDREPELQAGAFQYFQQEGDPCTTWPGNMPAPTLTADTVANTVTLSWSRPVTNNDGTPMTDLAGYRVMRRQEQWNESGGWWQWLGESEVASIDDPDTLTWTDASPDLLTTRNSYFLRPYDSCVTPHEGWTNWPYPAECLAEEPRIGVWTDSPNWWLNREFLSCNASTNEPTRLWYQVNLCGTTATQLWTQTCSRDAVDADAIMMKGWGDGWFYIDSDFYGGRGWVATYRPGQCDYPGAPIDLDLKVDADGYDQISINVFQPGSPQPSDAVCGGAGIVATRTIDIGPKAVIPPQIGIVNWPGLWVTADQTTAPIVLLPFRVTNWAGGTLNYTITTSDAWVTVSPSSGSAIGGEEDDIVVTIDPTGLAPGDYPYTITVSDPLATNNPQIMNGQLTVTCDPCLGPVIPGAPTGLTGAYPAGGNGYAANLTWTPPSVGGHCYDAVQEYWVYRCAGAGCSPTVDANLLTNRIGVTNSQSFSDSTPGKLKSAVYRWAVRAVNKGCAVNVKTSPGSTVLQEGL
jgi:hypothetical protein